MSGEFPGMKLILQLGRQFTKPLSTSIINFAKVRPSFRQHFLITPGRYYHWWESMIKIYFQTDRLSNEERKLRIKKIRKIDESRAMEFGAQLMLETLVFAILATFLVYETSRSSAKSQLLEETREQDFVEIARRKNDLSRRLEHQESLIQELRLRILNYSKEVGYSLPQLSKTLDDGDIILPKSEDSP